MTINAAELAFNLKSCSAIFVEKLVVSFGDDAIKQLKDASTLQAKRDLLEMLVLECEDETDAELMFTAIKEFAEFVIKNEADLKNSREASQKAAAQYKQDKISYQTNAQKKIDDLDEEFEIDQEKLAAYQLGINKVKAKELRKKARHRGLVALAKGAIAATVDGMENQYSKTANVVMQRSITDTKSVMRNYQDAGVETDTIEAYASIEESVIASAKKTSKDTQAGKDVSIINKHSLDAVQANMALRFGLSSESLRRMEEQQRQEHNAQIKEVMNG